MPIIPRALLSLALAGYALTAQAAEPASRLTIVDLGVVAIPASGAPSAERSFVVPPGTLSFSLHVEAPGAADYTRFASLNDPGGRPWIPGPNGPLPEPFLGHASLLVPNFGAAPVPPGAWRLSIAREHAGIADGATRRVRVAIKHLVRPGTRPTRGEVRLNLYFAPGNPIGSAAIFREVARMGGPTPLDSPKLSEARRIYRELGIELAVGRIEDIDARFNSARAEDRALGGAPNPEFLALMREFPRAPGEINVFFLTPSNLVQYTGISPIATAAAPPKTGLAGVIVQGGGDDRGLMLAHELGHHLGLAHTDVDQLPDTTPMQPLPRANLMDVLPIGSHLSPRQRQILFLSPAVTLLRP